MLVVAIERQRLKEQYKFKASLGYCEVLSQFKQKVTWNRNIYIICYYYSIDMWQQNWIHTILSILYLQLPCNRNLSFFPLVPLRIAYKVWVLFAVLERSLMLGIGNKFVISVLYWWWLCGTVCPQLRKTQARKFQNFYPPPKKKKKEKERRKPRIGFLLVGNHTLSKCFV